MGRTQHVLLCTFCMCIAALLPALAFAEERPADKPNTVFLPLALQGRDGPIASSSPLPPTPTVPVMPTDPTPAPPTPTQPAPAPAPVVLTPLEAEVVRLTNEYRMQYPNYCPALNVSPELTIAARAHSQDMKTKKSVYSAPSDLIDRLKAAGYSWTMASENVQGGSNVAQTNVAQTVVDYWMSLPDQRANILNCEYKDIGVGFVDDTANADPGASGMSYYGTQDFGTRP